MINFVSNTGSTHSPGSRKNPSKIRFKKLIKSTFSTLYKNMERIAIDQYSE